jgi:hypothetical protein
VPAIGLMRASLVMCPAPAAADLRPTAHPAKALSLTVARRRYSQGERALGPDRIADQAISRTLPTKGRA